MPKGGYRLLDMRGVDTTGSDQVSPGAYDVIESANGKPLVAVNLVQKNIPIGGCWLNFVPVGTAYQAVISLQSTGIANLKVVINQDDTVKFLSITGTPVGDMNDEDGPSASM